MSYDFEKNNSNYGYANVSTITAYPFTIGCWFKPESLTDGDSIISLGQLADSVPFVTLRINASSKVWGWRRTKGGSQTNEGGAPNVTLSTGTWYWAAFVVAGRYSHQVWVNGTAGTEFTTDMNDWSSGEDLDRIGLAALYRTSAQDYFDGKIAEYAIWKSALTQSNMDALAGGAPANTVGSNLWGWWRMVNNDGTSLVDSAGSTTITVSASGLFSNPEDHPTINTNPALGGSAITCGTGSQVPSIAVSL